MLIDIKVLKHLRGNTCILLERRLNNLGDFNCPSFGDPGESGVIICLLFARLNHVQSICKSPILVPWKLNKIPCLDAWNELDPFSEASLLDSEDIDRRDDVRDEVSQFIQEAKEDGLPEEDFNTLMWLLADSGNSHRTSLSSGLQLAFHAK